MYKVWYTEITAKGLQRFFTHGTLKYFLKIRRHPI